MIASHIRLALAVFAACTLAACGGSQKPGPAVSLKAGPPRVEATLELPGGDGRAHIIVMPHDYLESARCIVAVGPSGHAAVSCAPKGMDLPEPDQN